MNKQASKKMLAAVRTAVLSALFAIVAAAFCVSPATAVSVGAPRTAPPVSHAYGKTLTEWLDAYYGWYYGTAQDLAQSVVGNVQLMPLPSADECASGTGTPDDPCVLVGELEITLRPGTPFVLPLVALVGERYEGYPGAPDDDPDLASMATMSANLTIDGRTVVSQANQAAFTVPVTFFDPPVTYPEETFYGSVAAVWFTSIGIVSPPLPVGVHVIHVESTLILEGYFGLTYDNTWRVTVAPH
jgi:hypothetical protein